MQLRSNVRVAALALTLQSVACFGQVGDGELGSDGGPGIAPGDDAGAPPSLPEAPAQPLRWKHGSPLAPALVSGRIYQDLAEHSEDRIRDLGALGVRVLRIEIERETGWETYRTIVEAAQSAGIEVLAVMTSSSLPGDAPAPMDGDRSAFDQVFVPAFLEAFTTIERELPTLRFIEIWNEPDVYEFTPMFSYDAEVGCSAEEGAWRYALLAVRVYEWLSERRRAGEETPLAAGFGVSRLDDDCLGQVLFAAEPVRNHRAGYRPGAGLSDGPPVDILSPHGYGNAGLHPSAEGYAYDGASFAGALETYLARRFSDGPRIAAHVPVWITEVGYGVDAFGGEDPAAQAAALITVFEAARGHEEITALFWYNYRDDEPGAGSEGNRNGLRASSAQGYAPRPGYRSFQAQAAELDLSAPAGEMMAPDDGARLGAGDDLEIRGWAVDADGAAPAVEVAIDGTVIAQTAATEMDAEACTVVDSVRCPRVGVRAVVSAPTSPGLHEIALRASDQAGNARVIGRAEILVVGK